MSATKYELGLSSCINLIANQKSWRRIYRSDSSCLEEPANDSSSIRLSEENRRRCITVSRYILLHFFTTYPMIR